MNTKSIASEIAGGIVRRNQGRRLAFLLPSLVGGGAERTVVKMLREMSKDDIQLDLVVASMHGVYLDQIPKTVRIVDLHSRRVAEAIIPLSRYLRQSRPPVLISNLSHMNTIACLAKVLTHSKTAVICVEHCHIGAELSGLESVVHRLGRWLYPSAGAVVAVSGGVGQSIESAMKSMRGKVKVIFPPIVDDVILEESKAPLDHPWFGSNIPIYLGVGRLTSQKDFSTLLQAFYYVRQQRLARLIILGDGPCREALEAQIASLGLSEDVTMPGFAANPYAYMRHASAFVLSSRWEGMPAVLIEAMACGCPVVATDCPSGPHEILEGGRLGILVPVGDAVKLAEAMCQTLDASKFTDELQLKSMEYSTARATNSFLDLATSLTTNTQAFQ